MEDVLAHPMGHLPWALATQQGSLRKNDKSTLGKIVALAEEITTSSATVIDGMSLIQRL